MKKLYWRPSKIPRLVLLISSILAIVSITSIEIFQTHQKSSFYAQKLQAAKIAKEAMELIKKERLKLGIPIDKTLDPSGSGLIGLTSSPITSNTGYLRVKQTTANPNWAAVMVKILKDAGVKERDYIAIGISGSFPALAIATYAAAKVLKLKVVAISSVSASNWGANIPKLTWLDMEEILFNAQIFPQKSIAASTGGIQDVTLGMSKKSIAMLKETIVRNKIDLIEVESIEESVDRRLAIFREKTEGNRIAAYINVGGGAASAGTAKGKKLFKPGLNLYPPAGAREINGVMTRLSRENIAVINLVYIHRLADFYGLPKSPTFMPSVGEGAIFGKLRYNLVLASINLIILLAVLVLLLKMDIGYRIFDNAKKPQTPTKHPEPMV
jgi:poly-gamma-glutamate system protein